MAEVLVSPSWFRWHPTLPVLYTTNETMFGEDSSVTAFRLTSTGGLERMSRVMTNGGSCCHLSISPDGRWMGATNHAPDPDVENVPSANKNGSVALISLDPATGDVLKLAHHILHHPPADPETLNHADRDDHTPHAHSANWSPSGRYLFVCEKGLDRVIVYKLDPVAGALTVHSEALVTVGGAARHLAVHPNCRWVYVNEEKGGRVHLFEWDDTAGTLTPRQKISTLPADWASGSTFTSECSLAPGPSPRKFYVANRLGSANPPQEGTVAVFDVDPQDGTLSWVGMTAVGWHPRHFKIDPSNKWMLVSAVHDDAVGVYKLDADGVPQRTGISAAVPTPTHALFLEPDTLARAKAKM